MTTPDILAAAERYRKHLEAMAAAKPTESPYYRPRVSFASPLIEAMRIHADEALLARAYVERKEQDIEAVDQEGSSIP